MTLSWSNEITGVDWQELEALYQAAPLGSKKASELATVFTNSRFRCFVRDDGRLVAVGRAMADGTDCSYIGDVAVMPSHQRTGLGKAVMEELVRLSRGHRKIILYIVPGTEGFYKNLGFLPLLTAMALFQDKAGAMQRGHISDA